MLDFGQFSHTLSVERREVLGAHTSRGKVGWGLVVNRSHLFGSCLCSFGCRCVHCPFYFHCWRAFWFMKKKHLEGSFWGIGLWGQRYFNEGRVVRLRLAEWWYWSARTWRWCKLREGRCESFDWSCFFFRSQDQKLFSNLCKLGTTM